MQIKCLNPKCGKESTLKDGDMCICPKCLYPFVVAIEPEEEIGTVQHTLQCASCKKDFPLTELGWNSFAPNKLMCLPCSLERISGIAEEPKRISGKERR